jgi:transcriptional regulator with PAS, ATPase and Fis domain
VEISVADILYAIYEAKKFKDKIGMVVYKNDELAQLYKLKDFINLDCEIFEYETKSEIIDKLNAATSSGKLTLVGIGGCIKETAIEHNLNYIIIKSSEKSVRNALINAANICELTRSDKERAKRYQTILDYSGEGIISFDKSNKVTSINATAEKILGVKYNDVINRMIRCRVNYSPSRSLILNSVKFPCGDNIGQDSHNQNNCKYDYVSVWYLELLFFFNFCSLL